LKFEATPRPQVEALKLKPVRIGLWDRYGGSMPSGWLRWLLEQFEFPFEVVYPARLDGGNLASQFDVLIFVTGAIPVSAVWEAETGGRPMGEPEIAAIPAEYRDRVGSVTIAKTVPELKKFLEAGGTVLAIGTSTAFGWHLGLPITSALTEKLSDGTERALPREKYYVPGSILRARVDTSNP
jgi:hypothetical protein